jgi:muramoyltetrapeptide carboxypeptidase
VHRPYRVPVNNVVWKLFGVICTAWIALGTWVGCGPLDQVRQVMTDRLGGLGVPVGWGFGFGHAAPQPTVPLGVPAELDSAAGTLTFLAPAVT